MRCIAPTLPRARKKVEELPLGPLPEDDGRAAKVRGGRRGEEREGSLGGGGLGDRGEDTDNWSDSGYQGDEGDHGLDGHDRMDGDGGGGGGGGGEAGDGDGGKGGGGGGGDLQRLVPRRTGARKGKGLWDSLDQDWINQQIPFMHPQTKKHTFR